MTIQSVPHDQIDALDAFFRPYRALRNQRNRKMVEKINQLLPDVHLDFDRLNRYSNLSVQLIFLYQYVRSGQHHLTAGDGDGLTSLILLLHAVHHRPLLQVRRCHHAGPARGRAGEDVRHHRYVL